MKKSKPTKKVFDSRKILLSEDSPFSVQEAYKTLRTNVTFSLPGTGCKCIGIVSANRGDGKSSISANLAVSLAQINKRVILIDCDMRLPTIAPKLGIQSTPGLSNYLSGDCIDIPIYHDSKRNIDVIPSGNIPPDSTTLINSDEMTKLVETLKKEYDYVIFDFPPITFVSDAVMMSGVIDSYLVVVRHNVSEYQMISETVRQMNFADAKIIGFVYNGNISGKKYYKKKNYNYNYHYKKNS